MGAAAAVGAEAGTAACGGTACGCECAGGVCAAGSCATGDTITAGSGWRPKPRGSTCRPRRGRACRTERAREHARNRCHLLLAPRHQGWGAMKLQPPGPLEGPSRCYQVLTSFAGKFGRTAAWGQGGTAEQSRSRCNAGAGCYSVPHGASCSHLAGPAPQESASDTRHRPARLFVAHSQLGDWAREKTMRFSKTVVTGCPAEGSRRNASVRSALA